MQVGIPYIVLSREPESVPAWRLLWESCLSLCVLCKVGSVCVLCVGVVSVPNKGLCSVFIEQHRKHHMGMQYFTDIFYKGLHPWFQLIQITHIINQIWWILGSCFQLLYLRSVSGTHALPWVKSIEKCIRLKLFVSSCCKSWLLSIPKASKVGYYIVLLKAG